MAVTFEQAGEAVPESTGGNIRGGRVRGLKLIHVPVEELVPNPKNPRRNDHAVEAMRATIRRLGFWVPILIRGRDVTAGHLRLKAAIAEGMTHIPAFDVTGLSDEEVRALGLTDNRMAELAEWDEPMLADELRALDGVMLDLMVYDKKELDRLLEPPAGQDDLLPVEPGSARMTYACPECGHEWTGKPKPGKSGD